MSKTKISDLPDEMLLKIFEELRSSDILRCSSMVCKKWCRITQYQTIVNKTVAKVQTPDKMDLYLQSSRKFCFRIRYNEAFPAKYNQFTEKFFENIVELFLYNQRWDKGLSSFADTISSLMHMKNLRKLSIKCSFETYDNLPENLCLSITELVLASDLNMKITSQNVSVFYSILLFIPRLEVLSVDNMFYENQIEMVKQLKKPELTKNLKVLKWKDTIHGYDECDIYELKNLNLEKFIIENVADIDVEKLEYFLNSQKNLQALELDLMFHPFTYPATRVLSLKNLQYLSLGFTSTENLHHQNLEGLWTLQHLRLGSANLGLIFKFLTKNSEMESLTLDRVEPDMPDELLSDISVLTNKLKFLTNLKLFSFWSPNFAFKQDNLLQAIYEHLLNLKRLVLSDYATLSCPDWNITDFGITGNPNGFPMSRLKYLEKLWLHVNTLQLTKASIEHFESMINLWEVEIEETDGTGPLTNPMFIDY